MMGVYKTALLLSAFAHSGQRDKNGVEYIDHPIAVARMLKEQGWDEDVQAAAVLHDIMEDTGMTLDLLEEIFPERVVRLVDALTRRPREAYFDYIRRIKMAGSEARAIKIADLKHNLLPERQYGIGSLLQRYERALTILRF